MQNKIFTDNKERKFKQNYFYSYSSNITLFKFSIKYMTKKIYIFQKPKSLNCKKFMQNKIFIDNKERKFKQNYFYSYSSNITLFKFS